MNKCSLFFQIQWTAIFQSLHPEMSVEILSLNRIMFIDSLKTKRIICKRQDKWYFLSYSLLGHKILEVYSQLLCTLCLSFCSRYSLKICCRKPWDHIFHPQQQILKLNLSCLAFLYKCTIMTCIVIANNEQNISKAFLKF